MQMVKMKKNLLITNKTMGTLNRVPARITGSIAVTYTHTRVRKIVFPIAIFRKALNQGCGIFGAEYRNVITADIASHCQWGNR
jgi:hypothetical protein